jgi:hypothetical protein
VQADVSAHLLFPTLWSGAPLLFLEKENIKMCDYKVFACQLPSFYFYASKFENVHLKLDV